MAYIGLSNKIKINLILHTQLVLFHSKNDPPLLEIPLFTLIFSSYVVIIKKEHFCNITFVKVCYK